MFLEEVKVADITSGDGVLRLDTGSKKNDLSLAHCACFKT